MSSYYLETAPLQFPPHWYK